MLFLTFDFLASENLLDYSIVVCPGALGVTGDPWAERMVYPHAVEEIQDYLNKLWTK